MWQYLYVTFLYVTKFILNKDYNNNVSHNHCTIYYTHPTPPPSYESIKDFLADESMRENHRQPFGIQWGRHRGLPGFFVYLFCWSAYTKLNRHSPQWFAPAHLLLDGSYQFEMCVIYVFIYDTHMYLHICVSMYLASWACAGVIPW